MIVLDACAIIYSVEGVETWHARVETALRRLQARGIVQIAVSELSRMECLVKPLRTGDKALCRVFERFFDQPDLIVVPLTRPVIETAARLRAQHRLKPADALQAASALACGHGTTFITNNACFAAIAGLKVELLA